MLNIKKRGLLASAGALVTAVALAFGGAAAAQAAPVDTMPETSGLVITKLEQPAENGAAATGLEQTGLTAKAIEGVTFEAYKVPLTKNPMSNEGQQEIAGTTLAAAKAAVASKSADRTGITDAAGVVRWEGAQALDAGLWLVRETNTPAGVVAAGDFLVAAPLTHPTNLNTWLDTIYVYPKNHTVLGQKTVENAADLKVGDTVTWTITVDNPSPRDNATGAYIATDKLQIVDVLDDAFLKTAADGSGVKVTAPAGLAFGDDYTVNVAAAGGKSTVTIDFTAKGLAKVAAAATADVVLTLDTVVTQPGEIKNVAHFYSSKSQTEPKEIPGTEVKYGNYALIKKSEGAPEGKTANLAGAEFMVFASAADARAAVNGDADALAKALKPAAGSHTDGVWTTNADGRVDITGLRYSNFADGKEIAKGQPGYQSYWLVETKALQDHQLLAEPVEFVVTKESATQTTQTIVNQYDRGGFVLPLTGGTGTIMLTVAGIALLAVVLIVARRRQHAAE